MSLLSTIEQFGRITRYNIKPFLTSYSNFVEDDVDLITSFYLGELESEPQAAFNTLVGLRKDSVKINDLTEMHGHKLTTAEGWDLLEILSDIHTNLSTVNNSSKWLRSSIADSAFIETSEVVDILGQYQTVEDLVSRNGYGDANNTWARVALRNDLEEEEYTPDGGNELTVGRKNRLSLNILSVVDNIFDQRVYGLDMNRWINFVNDDIAVLSYRDTIQQTVEVLSGLKKGQNPEFPTHGLDAGLAVGSNRAAISFPLIVRQMTNTFSNDDTIKNFTITNLEYIDTTSLSLSFSVETRIGENVDVSNTI